MSEKRLYKRKLVNSRVKLFHATFGEIESVTRDISNGGIFVITKPEHEVPVGSNLRMTLLDSSDPNVTFNMEVIRHDKAGMGLMFVNFEVDGQEYDMKRLGQFWAK